jgi:transposase
MGSTGRRFTNGFRWRCGAGVKALRSTKATEARAVWRRIRSAKSSAGSIAATHGSMVWILDWARAVVAGLIERKLGIHLGLAALGELWAKQGLTPEKPLQRAYQRDPEAIEKWQRVNGAFITRMRAALREAGIDPARTLQKLPIMPYDEYLGALAATDVVLDTSGFSGGNWRAQARTIP